MKKAKAQVDGLRRRHENGICAATVLMNDPEIVDGARILELAAGAEFRAFKRLTNKQKEPDQCEALSHAWSQRQWLEVLREARQDIQDTAALERCGFRVRFPAGILESPGVQDALVSEDAKKATALSRLVDAAEEERCGSMCLWTNQYPYKLAGFLDPETCAATMSAFRRDVEAWRAAKAGFSPTRG